MNVLGKRSCQANSVTQRMLPYCLCRLLVSLPSWVERTGCLQTYSCFLSYKSCTPAASFGASLTFLGLRDLSVPVCNYRFLGRVLFVLEERFLHHRSLHLKNYVCSRRVGCAEGMLKVTLQRSQGAKGETARALRRSTPLNLQVAEAPLFSGRHEVQEGQLLTIRPEYQRQCFIALPPGPGCAACQIAPVDSCQTGMSATRQAGGLVSRAQTFWNSPTGPRTTHFWGPIANWGFVIAVSSRQPYREPQEDTSLASTSTVRQSQALDLCRGFRTQESQLSWFHQI